jgi:hypothetical protein
MVSTVDSPAAGNEMVPLFSPVPLLSPPEDEHPANRKTAAQISAKINFFDFKILERINRE